MSVEYLKKLKKPEEKILAYANRITGKAFPKLSLGEYISNQWGVYHKTYTGYDYATDLIMKVDDYSCEYMGLNFDEDWVRYVYENLPEEEKYNYANGWNEKIDNEINCLKSKSDSLENSKIDLSFCYVNEQYEDIEELKHDTRFVSQIPRDRLLEFGQKICPWLNKGRVRWDDLVFYNDNKLWLYYTYVDEVKYGVNEVGKEFLALKFCDYACIQFKAGRYGELILNTERKTEEYIKFMCENIPNSLKEEYMKGLNHIEEYYKEEEEGQELC